MDTDDANLLAAASVTDISQLPASYRQTFPQVVEATLVKVFGESTNDAREKVQSFFAPGEGGPSLFTFHLSPLQIAADLSSSGNRALDKNQLARYVDVQETWIRSLGLLEDTSPTDRSPLDDPNDRRGEAKRRSGAA